MKTGRFLKIIAVGLGGVYFSANCLFAYSSEAGFWADRRKRAGRERSAGVTVASLPRGTLSEMVRGIPTMGSSLVGSHISDAVKEGLPAEFLNINSGLFSVLARMPGTVRKVSLPPGVSVSRSIVVHIQDVHRNEEAQRNIGTTVGGLLGEGKASLLALEGASGDISLQPFRDFQNRQAVRQAADYLLKENKISGPIHAVLSGNGPLCPVIGIEDPVHYSANVDAYRRAVPLQSEIQKALRGKGRTLEQEKKILFSSPLREFDGRVAAYRARQLSLGDFVQVLVTLWKGEPPTPALRDFSKAVDMERAMDFPQVERERNALIEQLARKISPAQEKDLLAVTLAYRAGQIRPADFYARLNRLCEKNGISLAAFPAMGDYLRYVLLADKINPESLYRDILSLEEETYRRLARTPDERRLVAQSKTLALTEKLVEFSLTPAEWDEYETRLSSGTAMGEALKPFESFYREAKIRDQAMADHLLRAMGEPSRQVAVLVTGGFHAEGLTRRLTQAGVTVVSFVPKIEKLDTAEGAAYLSVFTQEKTPLDKLFLSEKLFLADHPVSPGILHTLLPVLTVVAALYLGGLMLNLDPQVLYSSLGGVGVLGAVKIVGDQIRFRLSGRKGEALLSVAMTSAGIKTVTETGRDMGSVARRLQEDWVKTKDFLKNQFTIADRINPSQIRSELIYVFTILTTLLFDALMSPVSTWVFVVSGSVSLGWFLWGHRDMFRLVQESTPDAYKKYVPWVYFPFVALGFVVFASLGVGAFTAVASLADTGSGVPLAAVLSGAVLGFLKTVTVLHRISNIYLPVPAIAKKKKPLPPEAIPTAKIDLNKVNEIFQKLIDGFKLSSTIARSNLSHKRDSPDLDANLATELANTFEETRKLAISMDDRAKQLLEIEGSWDDFVNEIDGQDEADLKHAEKVFRLFDVLQRYIFIPAGRWPCDMSLGNGMLTIQSGSWVPVTYLGQTIWVARVTPDRGAKFKVMNPAMAGNNGFVFYDPEPVESYIKAVLANYPLNVNSFFIAQKSQGISAWALNYGVVDLSVRTQLAASKIATFAALKNGTSLAGVSRDQRKDAVGRPGGPLMKWGDERNAQRTRAGDLVPEILTTSSILEFAATLDGLIENLHHVAIHFGGKKGPATAHLVGVYGLLEILFKASAFSDDSYPRGVSSGILRDQIYKRLSHAVRPIAGAMGNAPPPGITIINALLKGDLDTYEKLLALLEKIRDENMYSPKERFLSLKNRGPTSPELRDLATAYPIVSAGAILGNAPRIEQTVVRKPPKAPSNTARPYLEGPVREEGPLKEFIAQYSLISDKYSKSDGDALADFKELLQVLEGTETDTGFRALAKTMVQHHDVFEILTLVEDLLQELAGKAFKQQVDIAQGMVGRGDFAKGIRTYLGLSSEFDLMECLGREERIQLDGYLLSARALFVQGSAVDHSNSLDWVITSRDLFGFDDQELSLLQSIKQGQINENLFDQLGLKLLRQRMGKYTPEALNRLIQEKGTEISDAVENEQSYSVLGFRIFRNPDGIDGNYWVSQLPHIIDKLISYLENGLQYQISERLPGFVPGYGDHFLGNAAPNILYVRLPGGRLFFRVFDEEMEGGKRRKTIAIVGAENKANIKTSASGKMRPNYTSSLYLPGQASSFGSVEVFGKYQPVILKKSKKGTPDKPASLADRLAKEQWGEGNQEYVRYTRYIAPAWEWIYSVPGLNLVGQWGLSDWIIKNIFPSAQGYIVLQVSGQSWATGMGVFALGGGFWFGGGWLLVGAVLCALSLAHVFSGAHFDTNTSKWISLFKREVLLALVLMAPTLLLYWWDPAWLTGMGAVLGYLGAFILGVGANYLLHSYSQPVKKTADSTGEKTQPHSDDMPNPTVQIAGPRGFEKGAGIESSANEVAPKGPADFTDNVELRRDWAGALAYGLSQKGPRESLQQIGLLDPIVRLLNILKMENPAIHLKGISVSVRFIIPGVTGVPGFSPSEGNTVRVRRRGTNEPIDIYLSGNPRSVPHPFTELIRKGLSQAVFREDGFPSFGLMSEEIATLAEVLVNDPADGFFVPSRKLREIENMKPDELFLRPSPSGTGISLILQNRLSYVNRFLDEHAENMWIERWEDPLDLFKIYAMSVEKALATGSVELAAKEMVNLTRVIFHMGKPLFLREYHAHLSRRLDMLKGSRKSNQEYADDLVNLEKAFFFKRDFTFIQKTASRFRAHGVWAAAHLSEETLELMDFWKEVGSVVDSLLVADWEAADKKTLELGKKGRELLAKNNFSHFYFENILFDFLADYWAQRDEMALTNRERRGPIRSVLDLSMTEEAPSSAEIKSALGPLTSGQGFRVTDYQRGILKAALNRLAMNISPERRGEVPFLSKHPGHVVPNPHQPFLLEIMTGYSLKHVSLKTVEGAFGLYGSGLMLEKHFLFLMKRLGFHDSFIKSILLDLQDGLNWAIPKPEGSRQEGFFITEVSGVLSGLFFFVLAGGVMVGKSNIHWFLSVILADPTILFVSVFGILAGLGIFVLCLALANRFLSAWKEARRKDLVLARSFALAVKKAEVGNSSDSAFLNLGLAGEDLVRRVSDQDSRRFRGILKTMLQEIGLRLDFAQARDLIARLWGAGNVGDVAAVPEGQGARPLTVLYLDARMSLGKLPELVQRYSPKEGMDLVLVPTDEGSRTAVLDLPATFDGRIFDGGAGRTARVPGLAEVERRLERVGVNFGHYTGCRVVTPIGMVLDAEGVRSALFREALVVLLNGLTGVLIKREDLRTIDRAARAVVSAA